MTAKGMSIENKSQVLQAICPECEWEFQIEDPQMGEVVVCTDCNLNLMVTALDASQRKVNLKLTESNADDWGQ